MTRSHPETEIGHYENFPVASLLCPPALRAPIAAIYHFARSADDLADEGDAPAPQRLQLLHAYRQQLALAAQAATAEVPALDPRWAHIFQPLRQAIQQHALPLPLLDDLLDAFCQDVDMTARQARYRNDAELLDYCRRSANPVGRLLLHLYGVHDATALAHSDAICSALQLINFWQDPSVDIPRQRYYFSEETMARHGVSQAELLHLQMTPATRAMVQHCCQQARQRMLQGLPLVHRVPGRAGWELRLVVQGGLRILDKIAQLNYATLRQRPTLQTRDYAVMLWRALWM